MITEPTMITAGTRVVVEMLIKQFDVIRKIQNDLRLRDTQILSDEIKINSRLPKRIRHATERMQEIIRSSIWILAQDIESGRQKARDVDISNIADYQIENFIRFEESCYGFNVSYRSMAIAVKILRTCNENLKDRFKTSSRKSTQTYLMNAIIVYEILGVVIDFIERFQFQGIDEIQKIHQDIVSNLERLDSEDVRLEMDYKSQMRNNTLGLDQELKKIYARRRARELVIQKWNHIFELISNGESRIQSFKQKVDTLRLKQRSAKNQIETIQVAYTTRLVSDEMAAITELIDVEDIELMTLSSTDIQNLLSIGVNPSDDDSSNSSS